MIVSVADGGLCAATLTESARRARQLGPIYAGALLFEVRRAAAALDRLAVALEDE